jgi:hypothetical protein
MSGESDLQAEYVMREMKKRAVCRTACWLVQVDDDGLTPGRVWCEAAAAGQSCCSRRDKDHLHASNNICDSDLGNEDTLPFRCTHARYSAQKVLQCSSIA